MKRKLYSGMITAYRKIQLLFASPREKRHSLVGRPLIWKVYRDFQIDFLKQVGLQPEHYLLDFGCGTLRGGIPIIDYLYDNHYFGIDIRENVLIEAYQELFESSLENKNPTLLFAEKIESIDLNRTFDFIWAYSVLIHLSDDLLVEALKFADCHLKSDGVFYGNVNIGKNKDSYWHQGFPLVWRSFEFYQQKAYDCSLQICDLGSIASLGFEIGMKDHDQQHMLSFHPILKNK